MNLILAIPMPVRLAVLFVLGTCIGSLVNLGIYRLAWHSRPISPWGRADPKAPLRRVSDRLPIVGWLGLRREAPLHGRGFWVRPLLLELLTGIGLAALYWWEIGQKGLLPPGAPQLARADLMVVLHAEYAAHLILISLMLVVSMIDVDEKMIPDAITVPGTLVGLSLAALYPWSLLPVATIPPGGGIDPDFLHLTAPNRWPDFLSGFPQMWSLLAGLSCWWLWCVALMPRTWYSRHGWRRAVRLSIARLVRESSTYLILYMGLIGSAAVAMVWFFGQRGWIGLLSALVGMAASGGLVWLVRIIGAATLRREAMGFGDVTLMAMIGAFLGWQTCLIIFFLAPFAGLVVGLLRVIVFRQTEIPYGPFLCLATVVAVVCWVPIWDRAFDYFLVLGWLVPMFVLGCLALMAAMLGLWTLIRGAFR